MKRFLIFFILISLVSCSKVFIDQKVLDAWTNAPVEFLDTHSFFASLPVYKKYTSNGIEIRNYKNTLFVNGTSVTCNNMFYIKNKIILEYVLVGRCKTMPNLVPERRTLDLHKDNNQDRKENKTEEIDL